MATDVEMKIVRKEPETLEPPPVSSWCPCWWCPSSVWLLDVVRNPTCG